MTLYASAEEDKQARKRAKDERGGRVLGEEERRWADIYTRFWLGPKTQPRVAKCVLFCLHENDEQERGQFPPTSVCVHPAYRARYMLLGEANKRDANGEVWTRIHRARGKFQPI